MFSKFLVSRCLLVAAAVTLLAASPCRALVLTAEVYETPGLDGYYTYDITATIEDGYLNTFDFYGSSHVSRGITGPLYQDDSQFGVYTDSRSDTGFLVDPAAGLQLFSFESSTSLRGIYSHFGDQATSNPQLNRVRSWTFARLVTSSPNEVNLNGAFAYNEFYSDGSKGEQILPLEFSTLLSDITIGPAPELGDLPAPPPPPAPVIPAPPPLPAPAVPEPPVAVEHGEPIQEVLLDRPPTTGRYDISNIVPLVQDSAPASELTLIRNHPWIEHGDALTWRPGSLAFEPSYDIYAIDTSQTDLVVTNFGFAATPRYVLADASSDAVSATFQTPEPTSLGLIALASSFLATRRRDREHARR